MAYLSEFVLNDSDLEAMISLEDVVDELRGNE